MKIRGLAVGPFEENTYLVSDEATGHAILVDPGDEPDRIIKLVESSGAALQAIWLTHAHLDHIGGIAGVTRRWDVPVFMHPADREVFENGERSAAAYGVPFEQPALPKHEIAEQDTMRVGATEFTAWHVPGHSPGHVVFIGNGVMLGGDLLFDGSIGRVDLPLSNPRLMQQSLERIETLDDSIVVYPGHGPATSMGREKQTNPFLTGAARLIVR